MHMFIQTISVIIIFNKQQMVYIKLTNEMWIVSGLQKCINPSQITKVENDRYLPYQVFKNAAKTIDQPIHSLIKRQHIISNIDMKKVRKEAELSPQQKLAMEEVRARQQLRKMNKYKTNPITQYFEQAKDEGVKDLSKSISFGMTFIFSFFMAGLTGYYFGVYFMGLQFVGAMIVSVVFIMATIIIQTTLFIIKQNRDDRIKARKAKQKNKPYKIDLKNMPKQGKSMFKQQPSKKTSVRPKTD